MSKPTVFISHITEEGEIARYLKEYVEKKFLRTIEVFVSSHEESIRLGDEWLSAIKSSVSNCGLMVVICSPVSVARPWINFEAGAGWVRGIPVVPMCHSGLDPGMLPIPLNTLQGGLLNTRDDIQKLFGRLAKLADVDSPTVDEDDFFKNVHQFETNTKANILLKDSQMISNLMHRNTVILEYSIYASTRDYDFFDSFDIQNYDITKHDYTFNDIYRLFNFNLFAWMPNQKVYQILQNSIYHIGDTIKFILANSHLRIAPELEDKLNEFLFVIGSVDNWTDMIGMTDRQPEPNNLREMLIKMIKEEPLPATRRPKNMINAFIDYYDCLNFFKSWLIHYKSIIGRLTSS